MGGTSICEECLEVLKFLQEMSMRLTNFQIAAVVGLSLLASATASPAFAKDKDDAMNQLQPGQISHRNITYSDLRQALHDLDEVRGILRQADRNTYGYQGHGQALDNALRETVMF